MAAETIDDFRYNAQGMSDVIANLKSAKEEADNLADNIQSILRDKLMAEGIVGSTADVLIETFDKEVVQPLLGFSEQSQTYITQNETVQQLEDENSQRNQQVASM